VRRETAVGVVQRRDAVEIGNDLLQELQPLRSQVGDQRADAGHVHAGRGKAADEAGFDRIAAGIEHDRDLDSGALRRQRDARRHRDDQVDLLLLERFRLEPDAAEVALQVANMEHNLLAVLESQLLQAVAKAFDRRGIRPARDEDADVADLDGLSIGGGGQSSANDAAERQVRELRNVP
jgi:hypothetical protein